MQTCSNENESTYNIENLTFTAQMNPTIQEAEESIAFYKRYLKLPAPTELFISDPHGEAVAFEHIIESCAGRVRMLVEEVLGKCLTQDEIDELCTLIYYPKEKLDYKIYKTTNSEQAARKFYRSTSAKLATLAAACVKKRCEYSDFMAALPLLENETLKNGIKQLVELAQEQNSSFEKLIDNQNFNDAYAKLIETEDEEEIICNCAKLIKTLLVDKIHLLGDVYDRGPAPDKILDFIFDVDPYIQYGNHDIVWMGASLGQAGCIAHVVRNCARYGNLQILSNCYGIDLMPLYAFATKAYANDECKGFSLKVAPEHMSQAEEEMTAKIQKAMAIIQFKVEAALIDEYPEFGLEERKLLHKINYERGTVEVDGTEYELTDTVFPTVDPANPYELTPGEKFVVKRLQEEFKGCKKLEDHTFWSLYEGGSLYEVCDNNLLFHACVPLNEDGSFKEVDIFGKKYKGKALFDKFNFYIMDAMTSEDEQKSKRARDLMWYMWLGAGSPLFAKSKMATFEIYLIADKAARKEVKNPFYSLVDNEEVVENILEEFGIDKQKGRIICGHVPVKVKDGENPVKCNGKLLMIDGGLSRAYQKTTGIAGMVAISDSKGVYLAELTSTLKSKEDAIKNNVDIDKKIIVVEEYETERLNKDTEDEQFTQSHMIPNLELLVRCYKDGTIAQHQKIPRH